MQLLLSVLSSRSDVDGQRNSGCTISRKNAKHPTQWLLSKWHRKKARYLHICGIQMLETHVSAPSPSYSSVLSLPSTNTPAPASSTTHTSHPCVSQPSSQHQLPILYNYPTHSLHQSITAPATKKKPIASSTIRRSKHFSRNVFKWTVISSPTKEDFIGAASSLGVVKSAGFWGGLSCSFWIQEISSSLGERV